MIQNRLPVATVISVTVVIQDLMPVLSSQNRDFQMPILSTSHAAAPAQVLRSISDIWKNENLYTINREDSNSSDPILDVFNTNLPYNIDQLQTQSPHYDDSYDSNAPITSSAKARDKQIRDLNRENKSLLKTKEEHIDTINNLKQRVQDLERDNTHLKTRMYNKLNELERQIPYLLRESARIGTQENEEDSSSMSKTCGETSKTCCNCEHCELKSQQIQSLFSDQMLHVFSAWENESTETQKKLEKERSEKKQLQLEFDAYKTEMEAKIKELEKGRSQ